MKYNWQQPDWPAFTFRRDEIDDLLFSFAEQTGHISGSLNAMPGKTQQAFVIDTMIAEAIKTSQIEGEYLSRKDVASSIKNKLGINTNKESVKDRKAQGAGELMVEVRNTFAAPLTEKTLFTWHSLLMQGSIGIAAGAWRTHEDPMQVISGAMGKQKVHFEAPPSSTVPAAMKRFIHWFNETAPAGKQKIKKAPLRAAIAHLYFESLHPFEDGNGRIGRAIAEKALSQTLGRPVLLSLSKAIEAKKNLYYKNLEAAQQSNEITGWLKYFIATILEAQLHTKQMVDFILKKSKFFDRFKNTLSERQLKAVNKMLDAGPEGFKGGMNAAKYISIAKTSKATATRDLQNLVEQSVLLIAGGGRSTSYTLNLEDSGIEKR